MRTALLAAVVGAVLYGSGTVLQALAARRASGPSVLRHPWYVAGLGCDVLGWLASLVALRSLPLFTVQAVLAGALVVTVLLARVLLHAPLRRLDAAAVVVVVVALVVLAAAAGPEPVARELPDGFTATVLVAGGLLAIVSFGCYRRGTGWLFALLAALGASGAAICARAATLPAGAGTAELVRAVLAEPLAWAVAGFGLLMTVAYARALERAGVGATAAVMAVVEVVVPAAVGLLVLHDSVRPGWAVGAASAAVLALAACVALAVSPATTATGPVPVAAPAAR